MNGLSDSLSIGILITLVFGALFFYLYNRQLQNEKRTGLIERMLIDLKMSSENLWSNITAPAAPTLSNGGLVERTEEESVDNVQPVSEPFPLESEDLDSAEEDLAAAAAAVTTSAAPADTTTAAEERKLIELLASSPVSSSSLPKPQANYSSMTLKELKQIAKQRGLSHPHNAGKREITDLLLKADSGKSEPTATVTEPVAGSLLSGVSTDAATADLVTDFGMTS